MFAFALRLMIQNLEVDVTKPLLSKFRLNGRVWGIQYEGLRQICFKCGHLGHKEDGCRIFRTEGKDQEHQVVGSEMGVGSGKVAQWKAPTKPGEIEKYGAWMVVQQSIRKYGSKTKSDQSKGQSASDRTKNKQSVSQTKTVEATT